MLALARRTGETLVLWHGDARIEIYVDRIARDLVKLAITAPPSVRVLRGELEGRAPQRQIAKPRKAS